MIKRITCPVCGEKVNLKNKFNLPRFAIVHCGVCGVDFRDVTLNLAETKKLYSKDYFERLQKDYFDTTKSGRWKQAEERMQLVEHASGLTAGKLLDVGCAKGVFLNVAGKAGWKTEGTEVSAFAAGVARENYNIKVYTGDLIAAKFGRNSFDVVTGWDMIDHVEMTSEYVKEIYRILRPGGWLFLQTTMTDSLVFLLAGFVYWLTNGKLYQLVDIGYPIHHAVSFNRKAFQKILRDNDFSVISLINSEMRYDQTSLPKWSRWGLDLIGVVGRLTGKTIEATVVGQKKLV